MTSNNNYIDLNNDFAATSRILSAVPGHIVWKDINSKFICANQFAINRLGFDNFEQIAGKSPFDINCKVAEMGNTIIANDQFTMQHSGIIKILCSVYLNDCWGFYMGQQQPLKNQQGEIVGVSVHCFDVKGSAIVDQFAWLFLEESKKGTQTIRQGVYRCLENPSNWQLSPRQEECLFWLLRGKSAKEIAILLGVSNRTVEHYIELIKEKSRTKNKAELVDLATYRGFTGNLPKHWCKGL